MNVLDSGHESLQVELLSPEDEHVPRRVELSEDITDTEIAAERAYRCDHLVHDVVVLARLDPIIEALVEVLEVVTKLAILQAMPRLKR